MHQNLKSAFSLVTICFFASICSVNLLAQTTIFSENFESGGSTFTLNTTDVNSIVSNVNAWVINNAYIGGSVDFAPCGLPFQTVANNTPNQPGSFLNAPNSTYLHVNSICAAQSGVDNCNYLAAFPLLIPSQNIFVKSTNSLSTLGFTNVQISFQWLCVGSSFSFGEAYYSTNNGITWNLFAGNLFGSLNWVPSNFSNPALDNQPSLIFGFRFVNNESIEGADPALGIDEIVVSGTASTVNTISTGSVNAGPYCPGDIISIPFTSSGTFNGGNVYTAQLSNATGSFASPTSIGTLNSTANSGIITATIPAGALAGVAYQIQVVSSNPAITGSPNGTNIIINGPPTASISAITSINICTGETVGFAFSGSAGNIQWQQSTDAINYTNIASAINSTYTSLPLISNTYFRAVITNNCGTSNSTSILVSISSGITATIIQSPSGNNLCNGPITLSIPSGYVNITWSNGQMATSTIVVTTPGDYSVTANTVSGCPVTSNTVSIIETTPTPLLVNPTGPITLCSGSATLTAQSGFSNYSWNSGQLTATITVTSGGNFIVTAIDANGCPSTSIPVEISIGSSVPILITPANAAICSGVPALLTASTGFISYLWSNGAITPSISVADAGFYSVTGIDANGCNGASTSVSVVKSEYPIANFIYTQTAGFTLQFDNSSQNAINQQWIFGSIGSSPDVNPQYSFPSNGVYPVTLIISNPCGEDTIVKTIVVVPLGFQGSDALGFHVSISPNPFNSFINLQSILSYPSDIKISLTDMMGKVVLNKSWNSLTENNVLEVPDVPNGLYILSLQSARGFVSFKLVRS